MNNKQAKEKTKDFKASIRRLGNNENFYGKSIIEKDMIQQEKDDKEINKMIDEGILEKPDFDNLVEYPIQMWQKEFDELLVSSYINSYCKRKIKQFISNLLEEKDKEQIEAIDNVMKTCDNCCRIEKEDALKKQKKDIIENFKGIQSMDRKMLSIKEIIKLLK